MPRRFSIIIVHRNGAAMLLKALAALHAACDIERDEIFVVDNGSTDDSPDQVATDFPHVQLIRNPCNNGFARANNQAIMLAKGRYLLLLNSDAILDTDGLTRLEKHFETQPGAGLIGGNLMDPDAKPQNSGHVFPSFLGELGLSLGKRHKTPHNEESLVEYDWIVGACMAARRMAVDGAGPLDPEFFFYYEDTEWCLRLRRHGWRIYVAQDVHATHLRGMSTRSLRREALVEELRSHLIYYKKAFSMPAATILTVHRIARLALKSILWGTAALVTFGMAAHLRLRAIRYLHPIIWVFAGMPASWGLPDRCPYPPDATKGNKL